MGTQIGNCMFCIIIRAYVEGIYYLLQVISTLGYLMDR
jgi:hypothetical protein